MVFGIGKNGGTFGDEEPDDLDSNEELIPAAPAGSFKKGGHVKKTGLAKVHKGETVIPALKSMRIQLHRDSDGKLTGFTVHHEHLPKPSKSPPSWKQLRKRTPSAWSNTKICSTTFIDIRLVKANARLPRPAPED